MPYEIKQYPPRKDGTRKWYVLWVTNATKSQKKSSRYVNSKQYPGIGFSESMTFEEARDFAKKLNKEANFKRLEERRNNIFARLKREDDEKIAYLPEAFVTGFEAELRAKDTGTQFMAHWKAARRVIKEIGIDAKQWYRRCDVIYQAFARHHFSPSYCQKIVRVMNMWCDYLADKTDKVYRAVPYPSGRSLTKIMEAYLR